MNSTIVLEDGLSSLVLEDGLGFLLLELSPRGRQVRAVLTILPKVTATREIATSVVGRFETIPSVKAAFDVFEEW